METQRKIHIVMSTDERQFIGLLATVNSLLQNTKTPELINLHILVPIDSKKPLQNLFKKHLVQAFNFQYKIKEFKPESFLLENIHVQGKKDYQKKVGSIMNFARFYFPTEFPELDKVIYLDADLIINGDIAKLYDIDLGEYQLAGVKIGSFEKIGGFNKKSKYLRKILKINFKDPVFNAGVYVTNLSYWRQENLLTKIKEIMIEHKRKEKDGGLYKFATQPPMNLVFNKKFRILPKKWNFGGLGYVNNIEKEPGFKKAKIWHWTGSGKPWEPNGMYKKYWEPYNLLR